MVPGRARAAAALAGAGAAAILLGRRAGRNREAA
jgi:hypothetical protein